MKSKCELLPFELGIASIVLTFALDIHPTVLKVTENVVMIKLWAERITQEVC